MAVDETNLASHPLDISSWNSPLHDEDAVLHEQIFTSANDGYGQPVYEAHLNIENQVGSNLDALVDWFYAPVATEEGIIPAPVSNTSSGPSTGNSYIVEFTEGLVPSSCDNESTAAGRKPKRDVLSKMPPVVCRHLGCGRAFGRKADLERHKKSIHDENRRIFCPAQDCPRSDQSFSREDKLKAHLKNHSRTDTVTCLFSDCKTTGLRLGKLLWHLKIAHDPKIFNESAVVSLSKVLARLQLQCCLVNSCNFVGSSRFGDISGSRSLEEHWPKHDLATRAKFYDDNLIELAKHIRATSSDFIPEDPSPEDWHITMFWRTGCIKCPICQNQICREADIVKKFILHLLNYHDSQEMRSQSAQLASMLAPWAECCETSTLLPTEQALQENVQAWKRLKTEHND